MTVQSYNGNLDFGFVACRELVPDVWRLTDLMQESMEELLAAVEPRRGRRDAAPGARRASASAGRCSSPGCRGTRTRRRRGRSSVPATSAVVVDDVAHRGTSTWRGRRRPVPSPTVTSSTSVAERRVGEQLMRAQRHARRRGRAVGGHRRARRAAWRGRAPSGPRWLSGRDLDVAAAEQARRSRAVGVDVDALAQPQRDRQPGVVARLARAGVDAGRAAAPASRSRRRRRATASASTTRPSASTTPSPRPVELEPDDRGVADDVDGGAAQVGVGRGHPAPGVAGQRRRLGVRRRGEQRPVDGPELVVGGRLERDTDAGERLRRRRPSPTRSYWRRSPAVASIPLTALEPPSPRPAGERTGEQPRPARRARRRSSRPWPASRCRRTRPRRSVTSCPASASRPATTQPAEPAPTTTHVGHARAVSSGRPARWAASL